MKNSLEKLDNEMADFLEMDRRDLNEGPMPQFLLRYKSNASKILTERNKEKYFFVMADDKFGFSELLVNQLMKFAYERGMKRGMNQGKVFGESAGYDKAMEEVKEKLGL